MGLLTIRDVPGPRSLGAKWDLFRRRYEMGEAWRELSLQHGDFARLPFLGPPAVLLSHPDEVQEVLAVKAQYYRIYGQNLLGRVMPWGVLATEGQVHDENRAMLLLALRKVLSRRIPELTMLRTQQFLDSLRENETVDICSMMLSITLAISASLLFPREMQDVMTSRIDHEAFLQLFSGRTAWLLGQPFSLRLIALLATLPKTLRTLSMRIRIQRQLRAAIAEVRSQSVAGPHADALSLLTEGAEIGGSMPDEFLVDNLMSLLLAAYETTANALAWALWEVANREDLQQRVSAEGDGIPEDPRDNERWINDAHWTDATIREALRLYPSVWTLSRQAMAPCRMRDYLFPAGTVFTVSQWVTHRDPRWFPDPLEFRAERWMPEAAGETTSESGGKEVAHRSQFTYFPFGGGKRFCVGKAIFDHEASVVLGAILRRWRLEPVEGCAPRPKFFVTMQPDRPMLVRLRKR
jgi:cytochrome P450